MLRDKEALEIVLPSSYTSHGCVRKASKSLSVPSAPSPVPGAGCQVTGRGNSAGLSLSHFQPAQVGQEE